MSKSEIEKAKDKLREMYSDEEIEEIEFRLRLLAEIEYESIDDALSEKANNLGK